MRMPLAYEFTYVASSDPSQEGTLVHTTNWKDFLSYNKLMTFGMIRKFIKKGLLKETGRYVILVEREGRNVIANLHRKF